MKVSQVQRFLLRLCSQLLVAAEVCQENNLLLFILCYISMNKHTINFVLVKPEQGLTVSVSCFVQLNNAGCTCKISLSAECFIFNFT